MSRAKTHTCEAYLSIYDTRFWLLNLLICFSWFKLRSFWISRCNKIITLPYGQTSPLFHETLETMSSALLFTCHAPKWIKRLINIDKANKYRKMFSTIFRVQISLKYMYIHSEFFWIFNIAIWRIKLST